ncbi:DUF4623 domain-containing protein [Sphingobacterium sp.]|uniref:DUF4623 domain-containing protein n=1 Tax=Sphingobacterium sp. TaxID=341027 RepID=UPI0028A0C50D|nr:DUF4623 domain-containing protein [Sphingobacterium sp.]
MKMKLNRFIGAVIIALIGLAGFSSCSEDFPGNVESNQFTDLKAIRIVNAGKSGTEVLEGKIDENKKTISFPRIDTLSDFSNLKFEVETSEGASLENAVYNIPYKSGDAEKEIIIKVLNAPRFKEYKALIRFKVPVYGADFTKPTVFDYSSNPIGNPTYIGWGGQLTRGSGFDGKYVLVVSRGATGIHLLPVEDLKANRLNPIKLNVTGVTGGTYTHNMGAQINGHSYVANLSTAASSPLKIYHWATPTSAPEVIANINVGSIVGAGARHGDNFSLDLDANGNGYAFFISAGVQVMRVKIENYNKVTETISFDTRTTYGQWSSYNHIAGTESYLVTGHDKPIAVLNNAGSVAYTMGATSIPVHSGDPRIVNFNGQRYLLVVTIPRTANTAPDAVMRIYNITAGANVVDALTAFEQGDKKPVYEFSISAATNTAPGTQSGFYVVKDAAGKDQKLMVYGATTDAGFAIVEFPVNVATD